MNVFEAVKQSRITTRQAAEHYGIPWLEQDGLLSVPLTIRPKYEAGSALPLLRLPRCGWDVIDFAIPVWAGKERSRRTTGTGLRAFPMRTGKKPPGRQKSQAPAEIPGGTVSGSKEPLLPYRRDDSPTYSKCGERNMPHLPRRRPFIPVCGSAEASPSGISAGCVRETEEKRL